MSGVKRVVQKVHSQSTPGQAITSLQNQENEENAELIPGPSGHQNTIVYQNRDSEDIDQEEVHCKKPTARKRRPKESKGKKLEKA